MKKVCLISDTVYDLNGVSRFIQDFAKESKLQNKEFYVVTSTHKIGICKRPNIKSIRPLVSIRMPFYKSLDLVLPSYKKMKQYILKINPDLLHISTPGPVGICALVIAKKNRIPIAGIYHTDFPAYLYKNTKLRLVEYMTKQYLKFFYGQFEGLFCRSNEYHQIVRKDLNFNTEKLHHLHAGINIKRFSPLFEDMSVWKQFGVKHDAFKVLYVGRISVEKNIEKLLSLWSKVNISNKSLILVGDDEMNLDKRFCKRHDIIHIGRQQGQTLSRIYASSDCFVFPSNTDTLGQVVMEAMASGLPVLVTNEGGPKTFVNDMCGYVFDIKNEQNWIDAIEQLSKKGKSYEAMSNNAYAFMQEKTIAKSFQHFWQQNEKIYSRVSALKEQI